MLAVFIVEGRDDGCCLGTDFLGVLCQADCLLGGDGTGVDDGRHPAGRSFDSGFSKPATLRQRQQPPLACRSAGKEAVHTALD